MSASEYPYQYSPALASTPAENTPSRRTAVHASPYVHGVIAVVGAACLLSETGSALDNAADPFLQASGVVADAHFEYGAGYASGPLEEASPLAAVDRVARTMSDLDSHDYEAIRNRATAFHEANAADILRPQDRETYETAVMGADTPEAVVEHLDNFMGFYGKDAALLAEDLQYVATFQDEPIGVVQDAALDVIDALAPLPRPVIYDSDFQVLTLGTSNGDGYDGQYSSAYGIAIELPDRLGRYAAPVLETLPNFLANEGGVDTVVLHEIGHAKRPEPYTGGSEGKVSVMQSLEQGVSDFVGNPGAVSEYAHSSESERSAEAFSWAHNTDLGPIHPDEARRYGSPANKQVLAELLITEQEVPGVTDYLVSLNPGLMRDAGGLAGQ